MSCFSVLFGVREVWVPAEDVVAIVFSVQKGAGGFFDAAS